MHGNAKEPPIWFMDPFVVKWPHDPSLPEDYLERKTG